MWLGPDATSAVFENVTGLTIVWKWTGAGWVSYVSDPAVPANLKTNFPLSYGNVLWVVATGKVDIDLSDPPSEAHAAMLERVVDGDTIDVRIGSVRERVRLIGIDTPEAGESGAVEATARLRELLADVDLYLEADTTERDRYDRLLRYAWVHDDAGAWLLVNLTLVEEGLARVFTVPPDEKYADQFRVAAQAGAEGRCVW